MKRVDEFIELLEDKKVTIEECDTFISSLTKDEFVYLIKKDFTIDDRMSKLIFSLFGETINDKYMQKQKSINARKELFSALSSRINNIIKIFNIEEIKELLPQIQSEYVDIKNMFLQHLIKQIHGIESEIDLKSIAELKTSINSDNYYGNEIKDSIEQMTKAEFSLFITLSNQRTGRFAELLEFDLNKLYKLHELFFNDMLNQYNEDEIANLLPVVNNNLREFKQVMFKKLSEEKAYALFLSDPSLYANDLFDYVLKKPSSLLKDKLIIKILSESRLYSLYNDMNLAYLKALISDMELSLDESSNMINTYETDINTEANLFIKNIRTNDKPNIKRGILQKISAKTLHDILNNVNESLEVTQEQTISYQEFIQLIGMQIDKAILFLKECYELSEEEKQQILNTLFPNNKYSTLAIEEAYNKVINKYTDLIVKRETFREEEFHYCYPDLLELEYIPEFLNKMIDEFIGSLFVAVPPETMNIFLTQLVGRNIKENNLELDIEFYSGRAATDDGFNKCLVLGSYFPEIKKIRINTNAYSEIPEPENEETHKKAIGNFLKKLFMIQTVFHELRHAYQDEAIKSIGGIREFYFMLEQLIHCETAGGKDIYKTNYDSDIREVDANLYAIISTLCLLRNVPELKEMYKEILGKDIKDLARQRSGSQLRKRWVFDSDDEKIDLFELFKNEFEADEIRRLSEEYPMLYWITDDYGYILNEEEMYERYQEIENMLEENKFESEEDLEEAKMIRRFILMYLERIHNRKIEVKKGK